MAAEAFVDTNVLVYVLGEHDRRTARAEALLAEGAVVSIQVLNELASVARKKLKMTWPQTVEALASIRALCPDPVPLTFETHEAGLRLAARYQVPIYDALIAAAALQAGCSILYSEDFQHGQLIDRRLRVQNPFLE